MRGSHDGFLRRYDMTKGQKPPRQMIACFIIIMFFIMLAFFIFTRENKSRVMEQNMEYIQDSTIQIAGRIDDVLSDGYDCIRILSAFLSQSLNGPEVDINAVRKLARDSVFDFIEFADQEGMDHNVTGGVSDARDRQYYLDGMKGNVGMEVIFNSRATHETLLMFYSPVTYKEEIVGVLIGVYQADNKLVRLLTATYFGESARLYLATPKGRIVASNLPLDTTVDITIADLAQEDKALADSMLQTMESGENLRFTLESGESGGCMTKLKESGWFLIQIFPEAANVSMVHEANHAGVRLEIMLLSVFGIALLFLIHIHRRERQNIAEVAEERGAYKNAVLAEAMSVFEANLTGNQIREGTWKNRKGEVMPIEALLEFSLPCDYDVYIAKWAEKFVDEGTRKLYLENTDRAYLNQIFLQGKSEITFDYYMKSLKGERIFVRRSTYLARDKKSGDIIAYSNVKDITEQKQRENQINQYEQILVMTASGIYQGVRQIDLKDFSTIYLSFENNRIIPYEKKDFRTWFSEQVKYVHPDDKESLEEKLSEENLLKMPVGGSFRCDFRGKEKNSDGFFKMYSSSVFKVERDGKLYVNLVTVDNTETVENEMRQKALIEDALFRAESASQAKTKFLSNMSHDIRTPLNAIIGFTRLAITNIANQERVIGYLNKIAVSGDHLLSLVNDVLDMSRIESGRIHLEETECDLSDVINELKSMLLLEMQARNMEFIVDTEAVADWLVICDRLRLNQILLNLLGNAMKFTKPGGRISFRLIEKPGKDREEAIYEFHVKDTGIGISLEFQQHIFEPFERERSSTVSGVQGTGLGMAITKNLVEMMNGSISVFSQKNVGTEFIVKLPMKKSDMEPSEKAMEQKTENTQKDRGSIEGQRILLVEDNDLNREIAHEILHEAGALVEEAEDGSIAVDMLLEKPPDYYRIVLMDIQMPIMDGYSATKSIRSFENKELAEIPIIAMTANAFEEDRKKALEAGMNGHVAKPINVNQLLATISSVLAE